MRTLQLKAQPTNAFFAAVNQIFGGSSQLRGICLRPLPTAVRIMRPFTVVSQFKRTLVE